MEENVENPAKKNNVWLILALVLGVIIAIFIIISLFTVGYNKIYAGVKINGVKLGGYTIEQAKDVLDEYYKGLSNVDVSLYSEEGKIKFDADEINASFNSDEASKLAYNVGRDGKFLKRVFSGLKNSLCSDDLTYDVSVDVKKLDKQINFVAQELGNEVVQPSYVRQGDKLIVNTGTTGVKIDHATIKQNS